MFSSIYLCLGSLIPIRKDHGDKFENSKKLTYLVNYSINITEILLCPHSVVRPPIWPWTPDAELNNLLAFQSTVSLKLVFVFDELNSSGSIY